MNRHKLEAYICLVDFKYGKDAVKKTFELIDCIKAAVKAKSGKVLSYEFDSAPSVTNPLGEIGTFTFDVVFPYDCEATLEYGMAAVATDTLYPVVEVKIKFP